MPLITLGLNHKTTPVEYRERLAFTPENLGDALTTLHGQDFVAEAAILSTCNRTELYCHVPDNATQVDQKLIDWFSHYHGLCPEDIQSFIYQCVDADAVKHTLKVASGLDSMVLGEPQILGQMKQAYKQAVDQGTVGLHLNKLFHRAFSVAKQVRTDTEIGSSPVSVAFAAVSLSKQIFDDMSQLTALMIGAGETIELAARHLQSQGIGNIIIANRTLERGKHLAEEFNAQAITLPQIPEYLPQADIVISSTASQLPILGKGTVEKVLKKRKHKPIFMVDIAVPRDVEAEVAELDDVYLYTVDDLQEIIQENMSSRQQAADEAEDIIDQHVISFRDWQKSLTSVDLIRELREQTTAISDEVLEKAKKQLTTGKSPEQVLEFLAHSLTNKYLHLPSTRLRDAGKEDDPQLMEAARRLLLEDEKPC